MAFLKSDLKESIIIACFLLNIGAKGQNDFVSPCPRWFAYEGQNNDPNKWFGTVTLHSEFDLAGIWMHLIFDRPSVQIGNWFGQVVTKDFQDYLIKNPEHQLKAYVPEEVRFYLEYDPNAPPPKLVSLRVNGRVLCPEQTNRGYAHAADGQNGLGLGEFFNQPGEGFFAVTQQHSVDPVSRSKSEEFIPGDFLNLLNRTALHTENHADLNDICGTVIVQPKPLITYGEDAHEGAFPWHAAIYRIHVETINVNQSYICGGSLISRFHVVTAAHCVTQSKSPKATSLDGLVVYLGKYHLSRLSDIGIQTRGLSEIIPFPQYDPQAYGNDMALIKFTIPVDFTDYVRPICLWQESPDLNDLKNKIGSVVGWGINESGKTTDQLMKAQMPVVSQEMCLRSYPEFFSRFTSDNTYCAGFRNGTSACNGDSGGGMVFPKSTSNPKNPVWQLRGIVSISVALQDIFECDASHYIVFTDVAKYLDWIKKSMK